MFYASEVPVGQKPVSFPLSWTHLNLQQELKNNIALIGQLSEFNDLSDEEDAAFRKSKFRAFLPAGF